MKTRKMLAILLTVCMMLTMMPAMAFADTTTEVTDTQTGNKKFADVSGHWASEAITKWAGLAVLNGDDRGFRPDDSITRAEMATILDNLMDYQKKADNSFADVNNQDWYVDAVLKANAAGILNGDGAGHATPTANITREEASAMLARAFAVDNGTASKTTFKDAGNISSWAQPLVFGMEANKYIGGMGNGNFEPKANVTRAEVVTMINNAVKEYYTTSGTYTANVAPTNNGANCVAIVKADGVIIKGAKITGDLIIAEGVGNGNVTLDGATITGKLLARGGGKNSIHIINGAQVNGRVSVERVDGTVRIVTNGVTIANLDADTEVILEGSFTNVVVAEGAAVEVKGQVKNISVEAKASLTITKDATVDTIAVEKEATGAKVSVSGTVNTVKTDAPKTEIKVTETAKVSKVEATKTATGTNVSMDKKAEVKTLDSDSTITTSGEGAPKAITGTGNVTNNGTGKTEPPASSTGGGSGGSTGGGDPVTSTIVVSDVTVSPSAMTLMAGGSIGTIEANVRPSNASNKSWVWSSSNSYVATVIDGNIVPQNVGTCEITVTTVDGNKTATCSVTVVAPTLSSIKVDSTGLKNAKPYYTVGDSLDITNLKVTGYYTNNSSKDLSNTINKTNIIGYDSTEPMESQTLTVSVNGITDTYNISIYTKPISYEGWSYCHNGTSVRILGFPEGDVTVPTTIDGMNVTKIGGSRSIDGNRRTTSVIIPTGILSIEDLAFCGYKALTDITIPNSVTNIGEAAFAECTALTSISIPDGVTSMGDSAFRGCKALGSINIPNYITSIGAFTFQGCKSLSSINIPNHITSIGTYAFSECDKLINIIIPESVINIEPSPFSNCKSLKAIEVNKNNAYYSSDNGVLYNKNKTILIAYPEGSQNSYIVPEGVTAIGIYAFQDNTTITNIILPESLIAINWGAYDGCTSLVIINIPSNVKTIKSGVFYGCTSLMSINVDEGNPYYSSDCGALFNKNKTMLISCPVSAQNSYTIPDGTTSIGERAFNGCAFLTNIIIPESITSIGGAAFAGCTSLTSITIPNGVTSIGNSAFDGCVLLTNITIPNGVTNLKDGIFGNCESLVSVIMSDNVTSIGRYAFGHCKSLKSIIIPNSVTEIQEYAFGSCESLTDVIIPDGVTQIARTAFANCTSLSSITIPNGVTSIGFAAFTWCPALTNINIPNTVTSIGNQCFAGCESLTSITIPNGVTSIGDVTFLKCTSLNSITIPSSVTNISESAFDDCPSLTIYGYSGSYAETYASTRSIPFVSIIKENSDCVFGVINSITEIINQDYDKVQKVIGFIDGKEFAKLTIADNVAELGGMGELYKFKINSNGEIIAISEVDKSIHNIETETVPCLIASFNIKEDGISLDMTTFEDDKGNSYKIKSNTVVYKAVLDEFDNIDKYEISCLSLIKPNDYIWMYDTTTGIDHKGIANIIIYSNSPIRL